MYGNIDKDNIYKLLDNAKHRNNRWKQVDADYEKEMEKCIKELGIQKGRDLVEFYIDWSRIYRDVLKNWEIKEVTDISEFDGYKVIEENNI